MSDHQYSFFVTAYEQNFPFDRITVMHEGEMIAEFDHTKTTNYSFNFRPLGIPKTDHCRPAYPTTPVFLDEKSVDVPLNGPTIAELVASGNLPDLKVTGSNIEQLFDVPGYEPLAGVLTEAYDQSARGKGKERHATDKPFLEQPIMRISRGRSGVGGLGYQIQKKTDEAIGMVERGKAEAACKELMGAIVYAAAAILLIREQHAGELPVSPGHHPE